MKKAKEDFHSNYYSNLYDKDYFLGKKSFVFKLGYRNVIKIWVRRLNMLLKYKNKGKLLDVGCALGYMLIPFSKHFKIYGVDCSEYAINIAKKNVRDGVLKVHNVEEPFPFKSNTFDVVTCFDVLEHLKNPDKMLKNIFKVMKKDGVLLLTTPNNNIFRKILIYIPDKMEHHISMYHINEIIKKMAKHNFKIIDYFTEFGFLDKSLLTKGKIGLETIMICKKVEQPIRPKTRVFLKSKYLKF